jgi:tetrahydromethanopterin S-methyltransferase subunit E
MNGPLDWYAAISGIIASGMIAWDHSRRITGWGFVVFCTTSAAWIISSALNHTAPLAVQNVIMFGVNLLGVYRYLIRKKANA